MRSKLLLLPLPLLTVIALALILSQAQAFTSVREPQWVEADEGLPRYGITTALAFDAGNDNLVYAAVYYQHGVYRSEDEGKTWQEADKGLKGAAVYALAASPTQPLTVYAGATDGLYRSSDGARSWRRIAAPEKPIYSLFIPGSAPNQIFAGSYGQLLVSKDGGQQFTSYTRGLEGITLLSFAMNEVAPDLLFASTSGGGLLQTADGGATWTTLLNHEAVIAAVIVQPEDGTILARVEDHLERSNDGGHTWKSLGPFPGGLRALSLLSPASSGSTILAGSEGDGVYITNDGGDTWRPLGEGLARGRVTALTVSPSDPRKLAAGTPHGVFISRDGGLHWQQGEAIGRPVVRGLFLDKAKERLLAGTTDGVYELANEKWQPLGPMKEETMVLSLAVDPERSETLYAGTWGASIQKSSDDGRTWQLSASGYFSKTIIPAMLIDPSDPERLFARVEYDRIIMSSDGGNKWQPRDVGLKDVTVFALAAAASPAGPLYLGTDKGLYRSADRGETWSSTGTVPWSGSTFVVNLDSGEPEHLQVGTTNGVFLSDDGGQTWRSAKGIEDATVCALVFSPANPKHGFAGTRYQGVYQTGDGGLTWQALRKGLDDVTVNALVLDEKAKRLFAATEEGVFTLDLRSLGDSA